MTTDNPAPAHRPAAGSEHGQQLQPQAIATDDEVTSPLLANLGVTGIVTCTNAATTTAKYYWRGGWRSVTGDTIRFQRLNGNGRHK